MGNIIWIKDQESPINVSGISNKGFKGYYKKYPLDDDFVELPDFVTDSDSNDLYYCLMSFDTVGIYLIKIINLENDVVRYINIKVDESIKDKIIKNNNAIQVTNLKLDEINNLLSGDNSIENVLLEIDKLPDGTDSSSIINKIEQIHLSIINLKKKTVAFINQGE